MLKICTGIALSLLACSCGKTTTSGEFSMHASPRITLLGRNYHLASYNQTAQPSWEFVTVRVSDRDYLRKGREYLNQHSGEIGDALEKFALPDLNTFPRQPF